MFGELVEHPSHLARAREQRLFPADARQVRRIILSHPATANDAFLGSGH